MSGKPCCTKNKDVDTVTCCEKKSCDTNKDCPKSTENIISDLCEGDDCCDDKGCCNNDENEEDECCEKGCCGTNAVSENQTFRAGVYEWSFSGGAFEVELRQNGTFYCNLFKANSTWKVVNSFLSVDWKEFGIYEFPLVDDNLSLSGGVKGDSSKWRQLKYLRSFNSSEKALIGDGFGTVWSFEYAKGSFEVQFHIDRSNSFVCAKFPVPDAYWTYSSEENLVSIDFGKYGECSQVLLCFLCTI